MKILVIQNKMGIGDMVIYLPFIEAISKKFNTPVNILVKESSKAEQFLRDSNAINKIIILERNNKLKSGRHEGLTGSYNLVKDLKQHSFDKVFIFNSSIRFNLIARIAGIKDIYQYPLLQKEKDYKIARQKIELSLESFYRSASSLVFQLNKRHVTRHMSIFRCIDQRFETGEIFIKWDEAPDEEWLLLIYIKNNSPDEGIVIEDKSNPEKNFSYEFKANEIFKASDLMVDSLTQLISRKRAKKD